MSKFSRTVLNEDDKGEHTTLESSLDLAAGITDEAVKQFLSRFDEDLKRYETHAAQFLVREEESYQAVAPERLEKILEEIKIRHKRVAGKAAGHLYYEFEKNGHKVRLHSFQGKDLMLVAAFKGAPLEKINQYNTERKFVRAVLYQAADGSPSSTLEANLDCQGGVTDGIVRYFVSVFEDEMSEFEKFLSR